MPKPSTSSQTDGSVIPNELNDFTPADGQTGVPVHEVDMPTTSGEEFTDDRVNKAEAASREGDSSSSSNHDSRLGQKSATALALQIIGW